MHIYLMYGAGGRKYSQGMDALADELTLIPGNFIFSGLPHNSGPWIEHEINRTRDKAAIIGHSAGANQATIIADKLLLRRLEFIACFDVSMWMERRPVRNNVKKVFSFYTRSFFNPFASQLVKTAPAWSGEMIAKRSYAGHLGIDDEKDLHELIIDEVKRIEARKTV